MQTEKGPTWNLEIIKDHVNQSLEFSEFRKPQIISALNSIGRYVEIFRYHGGSIHRDIALIFSNKDVPEFEKYKLIMGISERQGDFINNWVSCEANFLACIYTVRNLYDIFSQLVNEVYLNQKIDVDRCDIWKVRDALPSSSLKEEIDNLITSEWFEYLNAFANTIKHQSLVRSLPRITMSKSQFGLSIDHFYYRGKQYNSFWLMEALDGIETVQNQIIECGNALNKALRL